MDDLFDSIFEIQVIESTFVVPDRELAEEDIVDLEYIFG